MTEAKKKAKRRYPSRSRTLGHFVFVCPNCKHHTDFEIKEPVTAHDHLGIECCNSECQYAGIVTKATLLAANKRVYEDEFPSVIIHAELASVLSKGDSR